MLALTALDSRKYAITAPQQHRCSLFMPYHLGAAAVTLFLSPALSIDNSTTDDELTTAITTDGDGNGDGDGDHDHDHGNDETPATMRLQRQPCCGVWLLVVDAYFRSLSGPSVPPLMSLDA